MNRIEQHFDKSPGNPLENETTFQLIEELSQRLKTFAISFVDTDGSLQVDFKAGSAAELLGLAQFMYDDLEQHAYDWKDNPPDNDDSLPVDDSDGPSLIDPARNYSDN